MEKNEEIFVRTNKVFDKILHIYEHAHKKQTFKLAQDKMRWNESAQDVNGEANLQRKCIFSSTHMHKL